LIAAGHPGALDYTPRQMYFMLALVEVRLARKAYQDLSLTALACQGNARAIKKQLAVLKKKARL
jgi:hypothetical protein